MAAVTGSVSRVFGHETPAGPQRSTATGTPAIRSCKIAVTFAGTYASADNASTANIHTAIANSLRDGRTIALIGAKFSAMGDLNGTAIGAKTVATSSNTMTCELTTADLSTEWSDGALSTNWVSGVLFDVTYTASGA